MATDEFDADWQVILRNVILRAEYDQRSFVYRLVEDAVWDEAEYLQLERALASAGVAEGDWRWACQQVFVIFDLVTLHHAAHFDPADVYHVTGIDDEQLREYVHRFRGVVASFFAGERFDPARLGPVVPSA